MLNVLQFIEFGALVRRQAAGPFTLKQRLQAGHSLWRGRKIRDLGGSGGAGQEGENVAVQLGRQGRLMQAQRQEFGQAIPHGAELVGQVVREILGNCAHEGTSCEEYTVLILARDTLPLSLQSLCILFEAGGQLRLQATLPDGCELDLTRPMPLIPY